MMATKQTGEVRRIRGMLKAEFDEGVGLVRLDAIGNGNGDIGRFDAFDTDGNIPSTAPMTGPWR